VAEDREGPAVVIERRSGGGVGAFLLGAAVGAGLALLFAPQSGEETRATMRRTGRRMRRQARELADTGRDAVEEVARTGKAAAKEAREAIEQRLAKHRARRDESFDGEDDGV
jgi:gas vesicle protein